MNKKILVGVALATMLALTMSVAIAQAGSGCPPGFTPGFWKHNVGIYLTEQGVLTGKDAVHGQYSTFAYGGYLGYWDGVKCDAAALNQLKNDLGLTQPEFNALLLGLYNDMTTGGGGAIAQARADAANWLNLQFGYSDFV